MGSSVVGAEAGDAYSSWKQVVAGTAAQRFSTPITGGDPNWNTPNTAQSFLWAKRVKVTAEATAPGGIRYRYDGSTPTADLGHVLTNGEVLVLEGHRNIRNFQAVTTTFQPVTLQITAER